MSDFNKITQNEFMIEKIKERPISRKRLVRRTLITASMAIVFGLVACITILILEPIISNWLYPEEETEVEVITFPEDEEEMEPEDMLADKVYDDDKLIPPPPVSTELNQEQVEEILDSVTLDKAHYIQLYQVLSDFAKELHQYMVTITGVEEDYNWLTNASQKTSEASGVIINNNGSQILVLTNYSSIKSADSIRVTLDNGKSTEAVLVGKYEESDMAVISIDTLSLGTQEEIMEIKAAPLGSSMSSSLVGKPVIAMGSPMGINDSIGYGIITSNSEQISKTDFNYGILTTDIYGSQSAQGVLFDLSGKIVGVIAGGNYSSDMKNMIAAYGISDLRRILSILSNGKKIAYLGIKGADILEQAHEESQIPYGTYVSDVIINSPAMKAGLQKGDIIVGMEDKKIDDFLDFESAMYFFKGGQTVKVKVMRLSQGTYKEMEMDVMLTEAK